MAFWRDPAPGRGRSGTPCARQAGLILREVDDELLVYDQESDACISLEPDAAVIWRGCDGTRDAAALAALVSPVADESVVAVVLEQLRAQGLLDEATLEDPAGWRGLSRREMLVRLGVAGAAVPLVAVLVVPAAAAAVSTVCVPDGDPCSLGDPGACCSQTCVNDGTGAGFCLGACAPDGAPCSINDPGACCSQVCANDGAGGGYCLGACAPSGAPCSINDPGACCSQTCLNGSPTPTCQ